MFLHPQGVSDLDHRLPGNCPLTNVVGNPLETTIALSQLIFEDTQERFPIQSGGALLAALWHNSGWMPGAPGSAARDAEEL